MSGSEEGNEGVLVQDQAAGLLQPAVKTHTLALLSDWKYSCKLEEDRAEP
jgi:hypothetical protein